MKRLIELRKSRHLTQSELAEILKIKQQTLTKYELGQADPKLSTLVKLADFFHSTIDYLADYTPPGNINNSFIIAENYLSVCNLSEAHLLHLFRQSPDEIQNAVLEILGWHDQYNQTHPKLPKKTSHAKIKTSVSDIIIDQGDFGK